MKIEELFDLKDPKNIKVILDDPSIVSKIRLIEERSRDLQTKVRTHCDKHRQRWIHAEARKLFRENLETVKHTSPKEVKFAQASPHDYERLAEVRVDARVQRRMKNLEVAGRRMQYDLVHNAREQSQQKEFLAAEVRQINRSYKEMQTELDKDFEENKSRWVRDLKRDGIEKPEIEVHKKYGNLQRVIETERCHAIKMAYQERGIEFDPRLTHTHAMTQQ